MGISTEFYSDKIDINFIDVNAKSLWPFSTFMNQVLKFYSHFACSERLRKFPIKYGDLYICGRGVRKLPVQYWHRNHCCIWFSFDLGQCEPRHDKTNKMSVRPAKTQISLGIRPVWSVFAVRSIGLKLSSSGQRRLYSDWDAQADLSLPWAHTHFVGFVMPRLHKSYIWIIHFLHALIDN